MAIIQKEYSRTSIIIVDVNPNANELSTLSAGSLQLFQGPIELSTLGDVLCRCSINPLINCWRQVQQLFLHLVTGFIKVRAMSAQGCMLGGLMWFRWLLLRKAYTVKKCQEEVRFFIRKIQKPKHNIKTNIRQTEKKMATDSSMLSLKQNKILYFFSC